MAPAPEAVTTLPPEIMRLAEIARAEGFPFVDRLVRDWNSGANQFAADGERFFCQYVEGTLVGFGGLNVDPYAGDPTTGRIRHVYLDPIHRGSGIGARIVLALVEAARPTFRRLRLRTQQAASFYEHLGFAVVDEPGATHALRL